MENVGLEKFRLAEGDTLAFNKIIDLSELSSTDVLFSGFITPDTRGALDFERLFFTFTDVYDPDCTLTVSGRRSLSSSGWKAVSYWTAAGTGQYLAGLEGSTLHQNDQWGTPYMHSFVAQTDYEDISADTRPFTIYFDKDNMLVSIASGSQMLTIIDLDDPQYHAADTLWKGFTSGKVTCSVTAQDYTGETANFCITSLYGYDLSSENRFVETDPPEITVDVRSDYVDDSDTFIPQAVVGYSYPVPSASAFDEYSGEAEVKTVVYYDYDNPSQTLTVPVSEGRFEVNREGSYAIVYTAYDAMGNRAEKVYRVTAVASPENPLSLSLDETGIKTFAYCGEKVEVASATATGGSGDAEITVTASCEGAVFEITDGTFLPERAGVWTVAYTATDYAGVSAEQSYTVEVKAGDLPVFVDEPELPRYLISGVSYAVPEVYAKDYSSGTAVEIAAEAAVRAGRIAEEKKGAVMSGYFVLACDITLTGTYAPTYNSDNLYTLVSNDWNLGEQYGFEGTFDGKGHIIDGLNCTAPKANWSSAFVTSMTKNGVIKNLSFTNATVAGDASLVVAAGAGTCENIYIEYIKFGSGANAPSAGRGASTFFSAKVNNINQTLRRVVIDISACEFDAVPKNLSIVGPRCATMDGVYVIGNTFEESEADNAFISYCHDSVFEAGKIRGEYATMADMIADEASGENSRAFAAMRADAFWKMTEKLAMSAAVYERACTELNGTTHQFTNTETTVPLGQSLALTVNERYVEFSLKDAAEGVSLSANILSVASPVQVGDTITVVATSLLDNSTAEFTITVSKLKETITAQTRVDVDLDVSVNDGVLSAASSATLDLSEVESTVNGKQITVTLGESVLYTGTGSASVACDFTSVGGGVFGNQTITISISETEKDTEINLPVLLISKTITAETFESWQELASYVAVAAGDCEISKLGLFMNGYFVLGEDINYNKAWTPYKDLNFLYANAENALWYDGTKCGFQGVFDGCGHTIAGLSISASAGNSAFIVTMGANAELKNLIFTKASVSGANSFLVRATGGKYTNIYIRYSSISNETSSNLSTFAQTGSSSGQQYSVVVIDVTECTFDDTVQNVYFVSQFAAYNVYVVGKDYDEISAFSYSEHLQYPNVQFTTYEGFLSSTVANVSQWDASFWDVTTGMPLALATAE